MSVITNKKHTVLNGFNAACHLLLVYYQPDVVFLSGGGRIGV